LVGLGLLGGHAAELAEKFWGDADGDELFGVAGGGATDSAGATEFGSGRFGDIREIEVTFTAAGGASPAPTGRWAVR
jgi:hypothetical protein